MKKKITIVCLAAVVAVMAIAGASLAYFTDTEAKQNTFSIGNVDIILNETSEEADGIPGTATENGFQYDNIVPGVTYAKNVTVSLAEDSMDSWVFVELKFSPASELWQAFQAAELDTGAMADLMLVNLDDTYINNGNIIAYKHDTAANTYSVVYKYGVQSGGWTSDSLFTGVQLPACLTQEHLAVLTGMEVDLSVCAYAIQNTGLTEKQGAAELFNIDIDGTTHVDNAFNWIENHPAFAG